MRGAGTVALFASLLPGAAEALSCDEASVRDLYWYHEEQADSYVLVHGEFIEFQQTDVYTVDSDDIWEPTRFEVWRATFRGFSASQRAFDRAFEAEVTLTFPDNSFIAGASSPEDILRWLPDEVGLVWLQKTTTGYELTAGLCSQLIDTDPASIRPALNCLAGRWCPKAD